MVWAPGSRASGAALRNLRGVLKKGDRGNERAERLGLEFLVGVFGFGRFGLPRLWPMGRI